jgi:predicted DNA-binding protein YlxM (UPF0122 family)
MIVGDLFSGIGGFSLAAHWMGWRTAWFSEVDPYANRVLSHHWPDVPNLGDIRQIQWENMLDTPCKEGEYASMKKLSDTQVATAVSMYEAGASCGDIAAFYGVTRQAMWDRLRIRTTMRPQRRYGADNHFYRGGERQNDPAQNLLEAALKSGRIVRPDTCSECGLSSVFADGRSGIQAHHDDYNKPLDVRWLCQMCHHEWHKHNVAITKEVTMELGKVDVLTAGFP